MTGKDHGQRRLRLAQFAAVCQLDRSPEGHPHQLDALRGCLGGRFEDDPGREEHNALQRHVGRRRVEPAHPAQLSGDPAHLLTQLALIKLDNASIRGSRKAANTSLESFTQEKNCLHCHTYQPTQVRKDCFDNRGINLFVSHLLGLLCDRK
jgi:hypothetical protein